MGRRPQTSSQDTRQALIDAGLEMFSQNGYHGTSLRDIARAVGVRESALYHHFAGKEALFEAILDQRPPPAAAVMLDGEVKDVRRLLIRLGDKLIDRFCTSREQKLFRILMSDGTRLATEGRINLSERMAAGAAALTRLMDRLVRDGLLRSAAPEFLALEFFAAFLLWRQLQATQPDHPAVADARAFVRHHVDCFLRGAGAEA